MKLVDLSIYDKFSIGLVKLKNEFVVYDDYINWTLNKNLGTSFNLSNFNMLYLSRYQYCYDYDGNKNKLVLVKPEIIDYRYKMIFNKAYFSHFKIPPNPINIINNLEQHKYTLMNNIIYKIVKKYYPEKMTDLLKITTHLLTHNYIDFNNLFKITNLTLENIIMLSKNIDVMYTFTLHKILLFNGLHKIYNLNSYANKYKYNIYSDEIKDIELLLIILNKINRNSINYNKNIIHPFNNYFNHMLKYENYRKHHKIIKVLQSL